MRARGHGWHRPLRCSLHHAPLRSPIADGPQAAEFRQDRAILATGFAALGDMFRRQYLGDRQVRAGINVQEVISPQGTKAILQRLPVVTHRDRGGAGAEIGTESIPDLLHAIRAPLAGLPRPANELF